MFPQLSHELAKSRHQEFVDAARRSGTRRRLDRADSPVRWQGLTLRMATVADRAALDRLAVLDEAPRPADPVLLGVVMQRPVAALSLSDGRVIADPFTPTAELVELLRVRAKQLCAV
jgi:hypothetical protein